MDPRTRIALPWAEFIGSLGREEAPLAGSGILQGSPGTGTALPARAARKSLPLPELHLWLQRPGPSGGVASLRAVSRYDWSSGPSFPIARPRKYKSLPRAGPDGFGAGRRARPADRGERRGPD